MQKWQWGYFEYAQKNILKAAIFAYGLWINIS